MKNIIIAISGLLLVACIITKVANAQSNPQDTKKPSTETKMCCKKGPSVSCCSKMADSKTAEAIKCDPSKCKDAKSDTTKEKTCCANMKTDRKNCDHTRCNSAITKK